MDFKIRESYAIVDNKVYIDTVEGREDLLKDCGEEFYNHVLSLWDSVSDKSTYDEILNNLRLEKEDELESRFTERVKGSFITDEGYKMQFNTDDSLKMFGAIQLLESQNAESGYITDADDNTHYEVPVSVMKSVQNQMLKKYAQCHLLKQQYRAVIGAAADIDALNDIEIEFD